MKKLLYAGLLSIIFIALILAVRYRDKIEDTDIIVTEATPYEAISRFRQIDSEREIMVHCGASMRVVMEKIAGEFQRRHGVAVRFNFGGSGELLPAIEVGRQGDIFVCHDPYAELLNEKDLLEKYIVAGGLEPVIMVQRNNPAQIDGLEALTKPGIKVGMTDSRYSTAGRIVDEVLREKGWKEAVGENTVIESRAHNELALALLSGHIDAAVVWNFLPALYSDELDSIRAGVDFPETRVTVCLLKTSENPDESEKFLEFTVSDFSRNAFQEFGYLVPEHNE